MGLHRNLSGDDLHEPKGKFPVPLSLDDDTSEAYRIYEIATTNDYFRIDTTDSSEKVTVGNTTTNPKLIQAGTGDVGFGTDTPTSPNGNAKVVEIEGASVGVVLHSTNGGGTPYEIQNNSETLKIQYDTTNRMTVDSSGNIGFGADPSSPNGNAKVVEVKDTSVGLVLNSTNGGAAPWEMQHNGGDLKIIYDGADTLGGGAKTAIALDAAGAMRLGSEVATPSTPASGDGGQVYVKSDGVLYYQSDTVAETDLTASGGSTLPVVDTTAVVKGSADATKLVRIEADSLTTSTTRVLTMADQNVDLTPGNGVLWTLEAVSGDVSLTGQNKHIVCDTTGGVITVTLPTVVGGSGSRFVIKDNGNGGTHNVTVEGKLVAHTIDGEVNQVINTDYGAIEVFTDGTYWYIR